MILCTLWFGTVSFSEWKNEDSSDSECWKPSFTANAYWNKLHIACKTMPIHSLHGF